MIHLWNDLVTQLSLDILLPGKHTLLMQEIWCTFLKPPRAESIPESLVTEENIVSSKAKKKQGRHSTPVGNPEAELVLGSSQEVGHLKKDDTRQRGWGLPAIPSGTLYGRSL